MPKNKVMPNKRHNPNLADDDPEIMEIVKYISNLRREAYNSNLYKPFNIEDMYKPCNIEDMYKPVDLDSIKPVDLDSIKPVAPYDVVKEFQQSNFGLHGRMEDNFEADFEVEQIKAIITQPKDLWQIGRHRLMCGNPTDMDAVAKLMDGKKARMIFTDFSWGVNGGSEIFPGWKNRKYMGKKMSAEKLREYLLSAVNVMTSAIELGANTYIVSHWDLHGDLAYIMEDAGYKMESTIAWVKNRLTLLRKDYHSQHSPIWYGWQGDAERLCRQQNNKQTDLWEIPQSILCDEHPTAKPIELPARAMLCTSKDGDIILDIFGNLGTTMLAAEQTGRVAHLMESMPLYCDVIVNRYAKMLKSGEDIFLLRNGQKFSYNEVAENQ